MTAKTNEFMAGVMGKYTGKLSKGDRGALPRRSHEFKMPAQLCLPGVFEEDFMVLMTELTGRQELEAVERAGANAIRFAYEMARSSVTRVQGHTLNTKEREFFWEALGSRGRSRIVAEYQRGIVADEDFDEDELDEGNDGE